MEPILSISISKQRILPNLKEVGRLANGDRNGKQLSVNGCGKYLSFARPIEINNIGSNICVRLQNMTKSFTTNIAPNNENPSSVGDLFGEIIEQLRHGFGKNDKNISALVTGGIARSRAVANSDESADMVEAICDAIKAEGIEPTIIAMQKNNGLDSPYSLFTYKHNINLFDGLFSDIDIQPNYSADELLEELEDNFDYVVLQDNNPIRIIDTLV